jgi:hypothetical protein
MSEPTRSIQNIDLSDAEVTKVLDALDASEVQGRVCERRSPRRPIRGTALIVGSSRPGFTMADYRVRLRNISRHGVAFLSQHEWAKGAKICLELPVGPKLDAVECEAVVVRCRQIEDRAYEIGAEFTRPLC